MTGKVTSRVSIKLEEGARRLVDRAAAVLGKTRADFILESATQRAMEVVLDQRRLVLAADEYDAFIRALDNPPLPGPKLKALMRRVPAWER